MGIKIEPKEPEEGMMDWVKKCPMCNVRNYDAVMTLSFVELKRGHIGFPDIRISCCKVCRKDMIKAIKKFDKVVF